MKTRLKWLLLTGALVGSWSSFAIEVSSPSANWLKDAAFWATLGSVIAITIFTYLSLRIRAHWLFVESLKRTKEQLQFALLGSGDCLWDWNITDNVVSRQGTLNQLGYQPEEMPRSTEQLQKLIHPEDSARVEHHLQSALRGHSDQFQTEYRILGKSGEWCWVLDKGRIVSRDYTGKPTRAAGTITDITARKRTEEELRLAAEVIQSMNEVVVLTDQQLRITLVNHAFSKLMGKNESEVLNQPLMQFFSDRHDQAFYQQMYRSIHDNHYWRGEIWQKREQQKEILTQIEIKRVEHFKQNQQFYVVIFSDITEKKRAEDKLIYLANFDTLTGLPNRALFHQRLAESIQNKQVQSFSLICFDVDHFKQINDSLGSSIGDQLLQRVALLLKQYIPISNATLARFSGDEFTLILNQFADLYAIREFTHKILEVFARPITIEQHEITISPSIGISRYPIDGQDAITLLKNAQSALHYAKHRGRNTVQFYDQHIQTRNLRKLMVGNQLRRAIGQGELELTYQPKLDLKDGSIVGVEALLRWNSQNMGAIEPDEFIQVAEETGIVNELGNWVLREACMQIQQWQYRFPGLTISVNISTRQFQQPGLYRTIASLLADCQLAPHLLELEVTETMLMEDPDVAIATLAQLQEMGVKISVDDFGTGYSSLSYLKRLPINSLKIDKTFVQDLGKDADDEAITRAIISLAKNLNLKVIAEGVETEAQKLFLAEAECDQVQGFVFSPALSPEQCCRLLETHYR